MEVLGTYDPTPRVPLATDAPSVIDALTGLPRKPKRYKDIQLDQSRVKYWLGVGAQPSEPVERMLCLVRLNPVLSAAGPHADVIA
jgi:small subunit ribosomal protein S16